MTDTMPIVILSCLFAKSVLHPSFTEQIQNKKLTEVGALVDLTLANWPWFWK